MAVSVPTTRLGTISKKGRHLDTYMVQEESAAARSTRSTEVVEPRLIDASRNYWVVISSRRNYKQAFAELHEPIAIHLDDAAEPSTLRDDEAEIIRRPKLLVTENISLDFGNAFERRTSSFFEVEVSLSDLRANYDRLGSRSGRGERLAWWRARTGIGQSFLLSWSRNEKDTERLAELSHVLAETADPSIMISELDRTTRTEPSIEAVLRALRWRAERLPEQTRRGLVDALRRLLRTAGTDLRQASYSALSLLPPSLALPILEQGNLTETDDAILETISETKSELRG